MEGGASPTCAQAECLVLGSLRTEEERCEAQLIPRDCNEFNRAIQKLCVRPNPLTLWLWHHVEIGSAWV